MSTVRNLTIFAPEGGVADVNAVEPSENVYDEPRAVDIEELMADHQLDYEGGLWVARKQADAAPLICPECGAAVDPADADIDAVPSVYAALQSALRAHVGVRVAHRVVPIGLVMAGPDEFYPYRD